MKKNLAVCLLLLSATAILFAQSASTSDSELQPKPDWTTLTTSSAGIGIGADYGGLGFKVESKQVITNVTISAGLGIIASNLGVKYYLPAAEGARGYFVARYGIVATGFDNGKMDPYVGSMYGFGYRWKNFGLEGGYRPEPNKFDAVKYNDWVPVYLSLGYNFD